MEWHCCWLTAEFNADSGGVVSFGEQWGCCCFRVHVECGKDALLQLAKEDEGFGGAFHPLPILAVANEAIVRLVRGGEELVNDGSDGLRVAL